MSDTRTRFIKRKKSLLQHKLVLIILSLFLFYIAGFAYFLEIISRPALDEMVQTDCIIVLTGSKGRIAAGVSLLKDHQAPALFISGVNPAVEIEEMEHLKKEAGSLFFCCITMGHQATDTIGNAVESAAWLKARNYHSARLVTADYHMPRALLDFKLEIDNVEIITNPVHTHSQKSFWEQGGILVEEYTKYIATLVRYQILQSRKQNQ